MTSLHPNCNHFPGVQEAPKFLPDEESTHTKILYQTVNKHFSKTPSGKIFDDDLKEIFALMILKLDLQDHTSSYKLSLSKYYPYQFGVKKALATLENLDFNIDSPVNCISLSYKIDHELGLLCIHKFFDAKLLHSPGDRTRSRFNAKSTMQPTPKGVAIVKRFIEKSGIKFSRMPSLLASTLNSMTLFCFDRSFLNDKITYSTVLVTVLFAQLLGPVPSLWSPENKPDMFKINFDYNILNMDNLAPEKFSLMRDHLFASPLHHKYFANPESDSHVQYYISSNGVRVFKDKTFTTESKESYNIRYCVSGKAISQWLMDCTDILSVKISQEIGNLFIKLGYLVPIFDYPSAATSKVFRPSHDWYYRISDVGKTKSFWYRKQKPVSLLPSAVNSRECQSSFDDISKLTDVLNDSGLKYLFRIHLVNEYCAENINAYDRLKLFLKKVNLLSKLLNYIDLNFDKGSNIYKSQVLKLSNDCLATIYHIYFTYLSPKAPFVLNINYNLRKRISDVLVGNDKAFDNIYNFNNNAEFMCSSSLESPMTVVAHNPGIKDQSSGEKPSSSSFCSLQRSRSTQLSEREVRIPCLELNDDESVFSLRDLAPGRSRRTYLGNTPPTSARDEEFREIYKSLLSFAPIGNELVNSLYGLMEIDSFPKFLNSEIFQQFRSLFEVLPSTI
ncbi:AMSH/STAMBP protein ubiquitin specific-protease [Yamadazyma tenuis]|uniref:RGS domain-containing protein n=1 Tax=Candida tenuis (strain ATCC 10573 / BCRC 21748 / CBS 615 / JCM 9827 / NBRC 10315 / NRRL Y-1498 / VKM Y-70) TaxID=590646 RepID=G3B2T8_CANTC|nr:uncharacterized protein CANTEDRAFT_104079 [Yamadazyma tenuis ATCC 10573]EGV64760.1 hypothetical protein CANTEDRAFT_104079 [Yamadazyma tenuis ATCC 10573]WEJ97550.1 AMSH/STAMBP protein ubiquitin specific-protease [Yamadazyma tenuis]